MRKTGSGNALANVMTVDVEDYFQVSVFEARISREAWPLWPQRAQANTERVLQMLEGRGVRGTFFVLGWLAERFPALVRRIADGGHEIASHGFGHERLTRMTRNAFRDDVVRAKSLLEDITGTEVAGYRAPSYSICPTTLWAYEELARAGYRYSSSIVPIRHDLYGMPLAPRFPFVAGCTGVLEVPVTTLALFGRNWPCGGGGYFRLMPYPWFRWGLKRVNEREHRGGVFYFHPWELDPGQPRVRGVQLKDRLRHYLNLGGTARKLEHLLQDFAFDRMDRVFPTRTGEAPYPVLDLSVLASGAGRAEPAMMAGGGLGVR